MYCPRCNLHSEEYVDRCPLCDGLMEPETEGADTMRPPLLSTRAPADERPGSSQPGNDNRQIFWEGPETVAVDHDLIAEGMDEGADQADSDDFFFPVSQNHQPDEDSAVQKLSSQDDLTEHDALTPGHKTRTTLLMLLGVVIMVAAGYFFFLSPEGEQPKQPDLTATAPPSDASLAPSGEPAPPGSPASSEISPAGEDSSTPAAAPQSETALTDDTAPDSGGALVPATPQPQPEPAVAPAPPAGQDGALVSAQTPQPTALESAPLGSAASIEPPAALPEPSAGGSYAIHVGSFKNESRAESLKQQLTTKGYPASLESVTLPDRGDWFRVMIGSYGSRDEAAQVAAQLAREENVPTWIMNK